MSYILTKSKYIRGLQCQRAMFLDVHSPQLAHYSPETLAKFRRGRDFERTFKDTFPLGIDISDRLRSRVSEYPALTASLLATPGEVTLFEAGFLYDEVLVLADVVHKSTEGIITIYEVKNSTAVSDTFRNDVAIQHYVIDHALPDIVPNDIFCQALQLSNFYVLYNDGQGGFLKEDLIEHSRVMHPTISHNIALFKETLHGLEPDIRMSDHCDNPYACPYKDHCKSLATLPDASKLWRAQ